MHKQFYGGLLNNDVCCLYVQNTYHVLSFMFQTSFSQPESRAFSFKCALGKLQPSPSIIVPRNVNIPLRKRDQAKRIILNWCYLDKSMTNPPI